VDACTAAHLIDQVLVSSDSSEILDEGRRAGARPIERPKELSGSTASSESAVLHALSVLEREDGTVPDVVLLVQCTSPFMDALDLDAAVSKVLAGEADVAFSVANNHAFLWKFGPTGGLVGVNHDETLPRARRQDLPPEFRETGAFYVMRTTGLREAGRRFFGRIMPQPIRDEFAMEIDSFDDLDQARMMSALVAAKEGSGEIPKIDVDAVVTDFDGVHTDDRLHVNQEGVESVQVSREDGMGVSLARKAGVKMLILSTETNPVVTARAAKLEIPAIQGQSDKAQALKEWIAEEGLDPARVAYLGNDVNDLGCLRMVGWPVVVANAHPDVKAVARLELKRRGGAGAVRELCELVVATATDREDAVLAAEETEPGR
jgi:N-acylneuraminate cytidylyltransferase